MPNNNTSNNNISADRTLIGFLAKARNKKVQKRIISLLSVVVLLVTLNQTKLIADTLQRIPMCGIAEHMHDEVCVNEAGEYICGLEEHVHTDACYQQRPMDIEEAVEAEVLETDALEAPVAETSVELSDEGEIAEPAPTVDDEAVVSGDVEEIPSETVVELGEDEEATDEALTPAAMPLETEESFPVFDFEGRDYVALSEILPVLPLQMEEVVDVLAVLDEDQETSPIIIEKVEQDYTIYVIERFAWTDIAVETEDGLKTITLIDGGTREEDLRLQTEEISVTTEEMVGDEKAPNEGGSEEQTVAVPAEGEEEQTETVPSEGEEEQTVALPTDGEEEQTETVPTEGEEEQAGEGQSDEEASDEGTDAHADGEEEGDTSVDDEAVESAEDEEQTVESSAEDETDESAVEDETSESDTEGDDVADEVQEQQPQVVADGFHAVIDLSEVEALPLSLREIVGKMEAEQSLIEQSAVEPAVTEETDAPRPEVIEEQIAEDAQSFEDQADDNRPEAQSTENIESMDVEPAAEEVVVELGEEQAEDRHDDTVVAKAAVDETVIDETTVDYDSALLSLTPIMEGETVTDYSIDVIADFDSTDIIVDGKYTITLLNGINPCPAQSFTASTEYMNVSVTADAGAFPAGTTMEVSDVVDDETISGIADSVTGHFVEVERVHAVDISFKGADGQEIEPKIPISVIMTVKEQIEENRETVVVHMDNEGETSVVEAAPAGQEENADAAEPAEEIVPDPQTVAFTSDSFSVYAVVVTRKLETNVLASDGETYKIEVTYGPDAGIPDGAVLAVSEVTEDEEYRAQVEAGLAGNKMITLARFFDIKIMESDAEGAEEVHPAEAVEVKVTLYDEAVEEKAAEKEATPAADETVERDMASDATDDEIIDTAEESEADEDHIVTVGDPVVCAAHFENDVNIMPASENDDSITFMAEGFSVWGVVYTVDFYYGNYEYHLEGEGEILLSGLFELLGIDEDAAQVDSVVFTNDELIAVEKMEADWKLTSLMPFSTVEKLTVTMADSKVYEIRVEDAQYSFKVRINDKDLGSLGGSHVNTRSAQITWYYDDSNTNVIGFDLPAGYSQGGNEGTNSTVSRGITTAPINSKFKFWVKDSTIITTSSTLPGETAVSEGDVFIAYFAPVINGVESKLIRITSSVEHGSFNVSGTTRTVPNMTNSPRYCYSTDNVTFTAQPASNYIFIGWYNGDAADPFSTDLSITAAQIGSLAGTDVILTPKFATPYHYNVHANEYGKGYFTIPGYNENHELQRDNLGSEAVSGVNGGSSFKFPVVANVNDSSYRFVYWMKYDGTTPVTEGNDLCGFVYKGTNTIRSEFNLLDEDGITYIAFFAPNSAKLVNVMPSDHGSVSGGSEIAGTVMRYAYTSQNVAFTATPDSGYVFRGWYDENGDRISSSNPLSVNSGEIKEDVVLHPVFDTRYHFTLMTNDAQSVVSFIDNGNEPQTNPCDKGTASDGTLIRNFTTVFADDSGYEFAYWLKDDGTSPSGYSGGRDLSSKNAINRETTFISWVAPTGEHIIRLKWPDGGGSVGHLAGEMDPRNVTVSTNNNASFLYYYSSDEVTLTATPEDGKVFAGWYNGDELISTNKQYPVSSATKHMVLQPRFVGTYVISVTSNGTGNNGTTLLGQFKTKYPSGTEQMVAELWNQATTTTGVEDEGCTRPQYGFKPEPVGDNNAFIGWLRDDGTVYNSGSSDNKTLDISTKIYRDTTFVCFFGPKNNKVVRLVESAGGSVSKTMAPRQVSFDSTTWNYYYSSDTATLTAAADTANGYMFAGWYLDGKAVSYDESFSIQNDLPADAANISTLEAHFRKYKTFDVKITVDAENGIDSSNVGYLTSDYFEGQQTSYTNLKAPSEDGTTGHLLCPIVPNISDNAAQNGYRFSQWIRQADDNVVFTLNSVDGTTGALQTSTGVAETDARFIAVFSKGYFIRVKDAQLRVNTASGKVESKTYKDWTDAEKATYGITEFGGYTTENGSLRSGSADLFGWSYAYSEDGDLTLVAQPKTGYEFVGWFNFTEMISNNPRYMVKDAKYDMTLVPVFAKQSNNLLVWFDGTNGLEGGEEPYDTFYTRKDGNGNPDGANRVLWNDGNTPKPAAGESVVVTLPSTAALPQNNRATSYELKGWYNVYPGTTTEKERYFAPGAMVHVTDNTVFYADWFRTNYDVAVDDGHVITPVDTSSFIRTYMFDYNNLFNMDSIKLNTERSTISTAINYEYWDMKNHVDEADPLNFVFMTTVSGFGRSMNPAGRDDYNQNRETTTNGTYYSGIVADGILLRDGLKDKIFGHDNDTLGKRFVGEGKNLYQYDTSTGYFYYDSDKNAASFHDGQDKFYLYNYTNATNKSDAGDRTDFLPFNYGKRTFRESYGEVNYWFGMESNIEFFLPNVPGYRDAKNVYGNRATNGQEMVFKFAGDDDVWVYVDDHLVLDMGGVHGKVYGEINFSENTWTIAQNGAIKKDASPTIDYIATDADNQVSHGTITGSIPGFKEGKHKLTIYYLERGSSQSNCAIYFNIAPLYTLKLNKRDKDNPNTPLQGATFKVFTDEECSQEADVFNTYYRIGNESMDFTDSRITESMRTKNFTTGADGLIHISGFFAGRTYYIQETNPPEGYPDVRNEVIKITFDSVGKATVDGSLSNAMANVTSQYFSYTGSIYGSELFVYNEKKPLSVQKVWRNIEGRAISAPSDAEVTLELHRYTIIEDPDQQNQPNDKYKVQINVYYMLDEEGKSVYSSIDAHEIRKAYSLIYEVGYRQSLSFTVTTNHNGKLALMTASGVYAPNEEDVTESEENFGVGNTMKKLYVSANLTTGPVTRDTSVYLYFIGDVGDPPSIEDYLTITEPTFTDNTDTWGRVRDTVVDTIILPRESNVSGNPWKYTWDNLDTLDANNNKYYYYVKETKVMIGEDDMTAYYTDMYSNTGLSDGGMITVTNADETVRLQMLKQDAEGEHDKLAGAKFKIYLSYHGTDRPNNILYTPSVGYVTSGYEPVDYEYTSKAGTGIFYDGYLSAGRYWLVETASPSGYNMLTGPVEVLVESGRVKYKLPGDATYRVASLASTSGVDDPIVIPIDNTPGYALPSTGGPGTTAIYITGSILTLLALALLLRRKARDVIE